MKAARVITLAVTVFLIIATRTAHAQCTNDPTGGSILNISCNEEARITVPGVGASTGVDAGLALRFPLFSAATWWVSRHMSLTSSAAPARAASSTDAVVDLRRRVGN